MSSQTLSTRKAFGNVSNVKKKLVKAELSRVITSKVENTKVKCDDKTSLKLDDLDDCKKKSPEPSILQSEQENGRVIIYDCSKFNYFISSGPDAVDEELEYEMSYHPMPASIKNESDYFQLHEIFDEPPIDLEADLIDGKRKPLTYHIDFDLL